MLPFTRGDSVRLVDLDGRAAEEGRGHQVPLELPILGELLRRRPEVHCVIHAHPPASLLCGVLGLDLRPVFGSYGPEGMRLAYEGVPVYPRSVLICTPALGAELGDAMGERTVCLMRGHGITVVGASIEEATIRALRLETLAEVTLGAAQTGRTPPDLDRADIVDFVGLPGSPVPPALTRGNEWVWRHYLRMLEVRDAQLGHIG